MFKGLLVWAVGQTARIVPAHIYLVKKVFKRYGALGNFVILSAAFAVFCDSSPVSTCYSLRLGENKETDEHLTSFETRYNATNISGYCRPRWRPRLIPT